MGTRRRRAWWIAATAAGLAGCGSSAASEDAGIDTGNPAAHDAGGVDVPRDACAVVAAPCNDPCRPECITQQRCAHFASEAGVAAPAGGTVDFVVDGVTIDEANGPDRPNAYAGFDLDGLASAEVDSEGCNYQDVYSAYEIDLPGAICCRTSECSARVDNQLPNAVETVQTVTGADVRMDIPRALREGRLLLVIRLTGIDDWVFDDAVEVELYRAFDADDRCDNNFDGTGSVLLDDGSFGTLTQARWHAAGAIANGRFRSTSPFEAVGVVPMPDGPRLEPVHDASIGFDVAADGSGLRRGNFGAWLESDDVIDVWLAAYPGNMDVPRVIGGLSDLRVNPTTHRIDPVSGVCNDPPAVDGGMRRYGGISEGYGFTAVRVSVVGRTDGPRFPPCAPSGDAGVRD